jgi:hypothetical protein
MDKPKKRKKPTLREELKETKEKENNEAKVTVFGQEVWNPVNAEKIETCREGGGGVFGLMVLSAGIVLLLNYLGLVSWDFWREIVFMWPVLLILIGLQIILGSHIVARVFVFIVALCLFVAAISYGLVQSQSPIVDHLPLQFKEYLNYLNQLKK